MDRQCKTIWRYSYCCEVVFPARSSAMIEVKE